MGRFLKNPTRKAQIVVSDLIISLGVFLILLVVAYYAWEQQADGLSRWDEQARAQGALARGMRVLTQAPGNPTNWALLGVAPGDNSINSFGLAQRPGVLDPVRVSKLKTFLDADATYNDTRKKMGLSPYQVDVRISTPSDQLIAAMGEAPANGVVSGTAREMAWYNQSWVQVRLRLWRNDTS